MNQFGVGPEFAANCRRLPPPDGWRTWTDADGPIPDQLVKRISALAAAPSVVLGTTESYPLPGVVALIRVEPTAWSRNAQNELIEGCFRSGIAYLPKNAPPAAGTMTAPTPDTLGRTVTVLTAASLAIGTIATVVAMHRDAGEKKPWRR